jgi:threonine/homoserine/homoserine lactone efflux protein
VDLLSSLPAFVLAVLLISASPGPAMALIFRRAALRGLGGAVPTVLGLEAGLYVWALFAGAGFAALVAASEVAYLVLRVVGAAVLFVLGYRALRAAWQGGRSAARSWWRWVCASRSPAASQLPGLTALPRSCSASSAS